MCFAKRESPWRTGVICSKPEAAERQFRAPTSAGSHVYEPEAPASAFWTKQSMAPWPEARARGRDRNSLAGASGLYPEPSRGDMRFPSGTGRVPGKPGSQAGVNGYRPSHSMASASRAGLSGSGKPSREIHPAKKIACDCDLPTGAGGISQGALSWEKSHAIMTPLPHYITHDLDSLPGTFRTYFHATTGIFLVSGCFIRSALPGGEG